MSRNGIPAAPKTLACEVGDVVIGEDLQVGPVVVARDDVRDRGQHDLSGHALSLLLRRLSEYAAKARAARARTARSLNERTWRACRRMKEGRI